MTQTNTKVKWKLQGSAGTLDDLKQLIIDNYYWSKVTTEQTANNCWSVGNAKCILDGYRIIEKKGRFRFEVRKG